MRSKQMGGEFWSAGALFYIIKVIRHERLYRPDIKESFFRSSGRTDRHPLPLVRNQVNQIISTKITADRYPTGIC